MRSRRRLLRTCALAVGTAVAGCRSSPEPETAPPAEPCTATPPPAPTDAATDPRPYPDRPEVLDRSTVKQFVAAYERAFQYNDALAANPRKIGRTNELTVLIDTVSVTDGENGFDATVEGTWQSDFTDWTPAATPTTPTATPLPAGHAPFETSYFVDGLVVRREGVVHECR